MIIYRSCDKLQVMLYSKVMNYSSSSSRLALLGPVESIRTVDAFRPKLGAISFFGLSGFTWVFCRTRTLISSIESGEVSSWNRKSIFCEKKNDKKTNLVYNRSFRHFHLVNSRLAEFKDLRIDSKSRRPINKLLNDWLRWIFF